MNLVFGPLLAAAILGQVPAERVVSGEVVDGQGKAVAGAQVVFRDVRSTSDGQGAFRLSIPQTRPSLAREVNFLAYRPGLAVGAVVLGGRPYRIVLNPVRPRTVKVVGASGEPVSGARIAPRMVHLFGGTLAEVPESLSGTLATKTGPLGTSSIGYLAGRDQLVAVRVTTDAIGAGLPAGRAAGPQLGAGRRHDWAQKHRTHRRADHTPGRKGGGRVHDRGLDEGWREWVLPSLVGFTDGPLRTLADGSFETPDNLMTGATYRLVVREPGKEPINSDWITIEGKSQTIPAMVMSGFGTIRGRVVDRQGNSVGRRFFRPATGRKGLRRKPIPAADSPWKDSALVRCFSSRRDGFRFHGQMIRPGEALVSVQLTRSSRRPDREMKMLPDPIPLAESRAMARRLIEPCWKAVASTEDDGTRFGVLLALVPADPSGVLQKLETVKFKDEKVRFRIQRQVVLALAENDQEEAAAVAESIADAGARSWALLRLAEMVPGGEPGRKAALLDRSLQQARITTDPSERLLAIGEVAERWFESGEIDKAKALFAEGVVIANQIIDKKDRNRGLFAARLARVDLPAAP